MEGKRVRRFFGTRREAEAWLRKTLARVRREGEAAVHMPEALRVEAVTLAERLAPYGATLTQAVEHFIAHRVVTARSCSVSDLVREFLPKMREREKRELYVKDLKNRLARFEVEFGQRIIAEIKSPEIADWLDGIGGAMQTRKNYASVLRALFKYGISREYCAENPLDKIEHGEIDRPPPEVFTPGEMRMLLEHAPTDLIPWLTIGAFAGLRAVEVERLDWSEVDLVSRLIRLPATKSKTRKKRNVEIIENLAAWLAPLAASSGPVANLDRVRVARLATVKKAGLGTWRQNALRHSFASYHVAHHQNVPKTAFQLGHSSPKMIQEHYDAVVEPAAAAEWWQIVPPPDFANVIAFKSEEVASA